MTTPTATKTKRTKLGEHCPPQEIRDNTKARRAWLADKVAELSAQPEREAKIVGNGSYQCVAEYSVVQVEGRARLRGVCQFCGNEQVVVDGVLVLHGYTRPGDGSTHGRCPGMNNKPLNVENRLTARWVREYTDMRDKAEASAKDLTERGEAAQREPNAKGMPVKPFHFRSSDAIAAHNAAVDAWKATFPLAAERSRLLTEASNARNYFYAMRATVTHLQALLDGPVHGSPLTTEVVA